MNEKFVKEIDISDEWEIETDTGFQPISKIYKTIPFIEYIITTEHNSLICADNHILFTKDKQCFAKNLSVGDYIMVKNGFEKVISIQKTDKKSNMYDITVDDTNHRYYTNNILSHNTTITTCFLLWYVLFNEDKNVCCLANKLATAKEIMNRIQMSFQMLPKYLQQGVKSFNKFSMELENGSKLVCAATSSDSVRGQSFNCVTGNTIVNILYNDKKLSIPIKDLSNLATFNYYTQQLDYSNLKVLTSQGYKNFTGIRISDNLNKIIFTFSDNSTLTCTHDHLLQLPDKSFKKAQLLNVNDTLYSNLKIINKEFDVNREPVYDLINVDETHSYITNNVSSHNCVFIDEVAFVPPNVWKNFFLSTFPTISSGKTTKLIMVSTPNGRNHFYDFWVRANQHPEEIHPIQINWYDVPGRDEKWYKQQLTVMSQEEFDVEYGNSFNASQDTLISPYYFSTLDKNVQEPIEQTADSKIYEHPIEGHTYFMSCDCADVGEDYSAIVVLDISVFPYKQVAVYYNNKISYMSFPQVIQNFAKIYNDCDVLIESNSVGQAILHILKEEYEFDNLIYTYTQHGKLLCPGQKTTVKTKALGCTTLKQTVEKGEILLPDKATINELRQFVLKDGSYAANEGFHDDLVMSIVNFSFYSTQPNFIIRYGDLNNGHNLIQSHIISTEKEIEENLSALPLFLNKFKEDEKKKQLKDDAKWIQ